MDIKTIATGSSGNCYLVGDGHTRLLLDCGIPMRKIAAGCDYTMSLIDACLVTHDHKDHSYAVRDITRRGIPVWGTRLMRDSGMHVRAVDVSKGVADFQAGTFRVRAFSVKHDTECLGYYLYSIVSHESLVYLTDFAEFPFRFKADYWLIEANYSLDILDKNVANGTDCNYANRVIDTHMSIEKIEKYFRNYEHVDAREIALIHLSDGNSDADDFKRRIERITGVPTIVPNGG